MENFRECIIEGVWPAPFARDMHVVVGVLQVKLKCAREYGCGKHIFDDGKCGNKEIKVSTVST